jgi:hypothetical protein
MKSPLKQQIQPKEEILDHYINWFEIPALNFKRAVDFYKAIFQIEMETNTMNGYSMAFFPTENGVGGAVISGEGTEPSEKGPLLYLNGGNNLDAILSRVEDSGGRVLMSKQTISESAGCFALFIDSEGNKMALHSRS